MCVARSNVKSSSAFRRPTCSLTFHSWSTKLRGFWLLLFIGRHSLSEVKNAPHSRQEKPIDKTLCTCYNTWELTEKFPISYRGVEQLEARRAHNPEVVGSSPASATKIMGLLQNSFFAAALLFRSEHSNFEAKIAGYSPNFYFRVQQS